MNFRHKISVITPSINSYNHLERAIESVNSQDYKNWEHIIIDADSKDGTINILKKYPHLKWLSEPDEGQSDAMNKGFEMSDGDIIVYLNADDEFLPGIFTKIVNRFEEAQDPEGLIVITDLGIVDENMNQIVTTPSAILKDIIDVDRPAYPYNPLSYFYHRNIQESIGSFPDRYKYAMDYWFLLRAYKLFNVKYIPEISGIFHNYNNKTSDVTRSERDVQLITMEFLESENKFLYFLNTNWRKARKKLKSL